MGAHSYHGLNIEASNLMEELYRSLQELPMLHYRTLSNQQERLWKYNNYFSYAVLRTLITNLDY